MDPHASGRIARSLETLHALGYFAPEVEAELTALGVRRGRATYFASRSAPMGRVGGGTVAATFFVFNPDLVARFIPAAWDAASPEDVLAARYRGVSAAWQRLLGDEVLASPEMVEAAELARTAAAGCTVAGRPLSAAHADIAWPTEPHLALFHALTVVREHRGDGHIAALLSAGLTGIEALITHTATGRGFTVPAAKATRGWSDEQWSQATAALAERGLMTAEGEPTDDGQALRKAIERATNELGAAPWDALGEAGANRLAELCAPWVAQALTNGAFPEGVFA